MIDDIQFIAGKKILKKILHTFNALIDQKRRIVISSDKSPAELDGIEERMKSRMGSGLVVEIKRILNCALVSCKPSLKGSI